jgi:hypothetical protein
MFPTGDCYFAGRAVCKDHLLLSVNIDTLPEPLVDPAVGPLDGYFRSTAALRVRAHRKTGEKQDGAQDRVYRLCHKISSMFFISFL